MNKGHSITETAITVVILIILFAVFLIGLSKAISSQEQLECYKLQASAEQYKDFMYSPTNPGGFYITKDQKEMCDYHNIKVNAPIR